MRLYHSSNWVLNIWNHPSVKNFAEQTAGGVGVSKAGSLVKRIYPCFLDTSMKLETLETMYIHDGISVYP